MASLKKRGDSYYLQHYVAGKQRRINLDTDSYPVAREKLRQFESAQARGHDTPLPTRTAIADVLTRYVSHIRAVKTAKSAQTDIYYLREAFGPCCEAVTITSRTPSAKTRKRPRVKKVDRRFRAKVIDAPYFEAVSANLIASFIDGQVQGRHLAPKTANRYREILVRLFNWSMEQGGVRMPADKNPASSVKRYAEKAPHIQFLTLKQIDEQLQALKAEPQMQTMVAVLIFAGLRREELLWLTKADFDQSSGPYGLLRIRAKTVDGESWQPKTKQNRAVPVSRRLREYLDKYKVPASTGHWLFPSPNRVRWNPDNFSADLRARNTKKKLTWSNLDFRHTFGSQLAMKGESLYKIATLMGNSPEICRRHYAALVPEAMCDTVEFPDAKDEEKPATPAVAAENKAETTNAGDKPAADKDTKADDGAEPKTLRIAG